MQPPVLHYRQGPSVLLLSFIEFFHYTCCQAVHELNHRGQRISLKLGHTVHSLFPGEERAAHHGAKRISVAPQGQTEASMEPVLQLWSTLRLFCKQPLITRNSRRGSAEISYIASTLLHSRGRALLRQPDQLHGAVHNSRLGDLLCTHDNTACKQTAFSWPTHCFTVIQACSSTFRSSSISVTVWPHFCKQVWWRISSIDTRPPALFPAFVKMTLCKTCCKWISQPQKYGIRHSLTCTSVRHDESEFYFECHKWVFLQVILIHVLAVFICSFLLLAPLFGYLGDRYNRKYIMIAGLSIWLVTAASSSFVSKWVSAKIDARTLIRSAKTRSSKMTQTHFLWRIIFFFLYLTSSSLFKWKWPWSSVQSVFDGRLFLLS